MAQTAYLRLAILTRHDSKFRQMHFGAFQQRITATAHTTSRSLPTTVSTGDAMRDRSVDYVCSMLAITFGVTVVLCIETIHNITSGDHQSHAVLFHPFSIVNYSLEVLLMLVVLFCIHRGSRSAVGRSSR